MNNFHLIYNKKLVTLYICDTILLLVEEHLFFLFLKVNAFFKIEVFFFFFFEEILRIEVIVAIMNFLIIFTATHINFC